jgi:hypothetical protein
MFVSLAVKVDVLVFDKSIGGAVELEVFKVLSVGFHEQGQCLSGKMKGIREGVDNIVPKCCVCRLHQRQERQNYH